LTKIIGIAGRAGSGKDTVADFLKEVAHFKSVAFAEPIRAGMRAILGLEDKHFQHPDKEVVLEQFGKSPREMMQTLGTQWGRECVNKDLWLILAGSKIKAHQDAGYNVAVTDVRFDNEAEYIRSKGGTIWHLYRDTAGTPHMHASESGIEFEPWDEIINNNGTLHSLHMRVLELWQRKQEQE
jgi:hypothetical protein